jgi:uncharacterized membrane protein YphA (DoxX/SURF4 family)
MNTFIWTLQGFIAITFLYSGINKSFFLKQKLIAKGQTGVTNLSLPFIRFIGIAEILGAIGIILPYLLDIYPALTAIASLCLALIMIPAAIIHYNLGKIKNRQKENNNVLFNMIILIICLFIAYYRTR